MKTPNLTVATLDAPDFVAEVERIVAGCLVVTQPRAAYIVKIDNWFGPKWLRFPHKVMGAFGTTSRDLVVPPFSPNRVDDEIFLSADPMTEVTERTLHRYQSSEANAARRLDRLYPGVAFFWWSGRSRPNGRGCLMAYLPSAEHHVPWYVGFKADPWTPTDLRGVTLPEIQGLREKESA